MFVLGNNCLGNILIVASIDVSKSIFEIFVTTNTVTKLIGATSGGDKPTFRQLAVVCMTTNKMLTSLVLPTLLCDRHYLQLCIKTSYQICLGLF